MGFGEGRNPAGAQKPILLVDLKGERRGNSLFETVTQKGRGAEAPVCPGNSPERSRRSPGKKDANARSGRSLPSASRQLGDPVNRKVVGCRLEIWVEFVIEGAGNVPSGNFKRTGERCAGHFFSRIEER